MKTLQPHNVFDSSSSVETNTSTKHTYDLDSISNFKPTDDTFKDSFQTKEQLQRDQLITFLLYLYAVSYKNKIIAKEYSQRFIWGICGTCAMACVIFITFLIRAFVFSPGNFSDLSSVVGMATAIISFSSLIFGLITIIAKYSFPKGDEKYITEIVKAIQDNDLKNKVENIKLFKDAHSSTIDPSAEQTGLSDQLDFFKDE